MSAPEIKGWCPGALRPMMSGDGLVVRIRPRMARLTAAQAAGVAGLSRRFGNGLIDLSARANIQLRGVSAETHPALIDGLRELGLVDDDATLEARRNISVTPFWAEGDETCQIAEALEALMAAPDAPALPGKFGFAVDCGPTPVLQDVSADIRIERSTEGLICRADSSDFGMPVTTRTAAEAAVELARWFLGTGGAPEGRGRMAKHLASGAELPAVMQQVAAIKADYKAQPGMSETGQLVGFEFGQMTANIHEALAQTGPVRVTPWRMLLLEEQRAAPDPRGGEKRPPMGAGRALPGVTAGRNILDDSALITNANDPRLRITACTGAPGCTQALGETRPLARALADKLPAETHLHVSGCAKGCAHPAPCALTLVATDPTHFNLIRKGRASDAPAQINLTAHDIEEALNAPHL